MVLPAFYREKGMRQKEEINQRMITTDSCFLISHRQTIPNCVRSNYVSIIHIEALP